MKSLRREERKKFKSQVEEMAFINRRGENVSIVTESKEK